MSYTTTFRPSNANRCSWDELYNRELENYQEDHDDEGTIWFSESNAEAVVLKQLAKLEKDSLLRRSSVCEHSHNDHVRPEKDGRAGHLLASRFLDLGTGNGHMLLEMCDDDEGGKSWSGDMIGVDYSETSVQLARGILAERQEHGSSSSLSIQFEQWNLLSDDPGAWLKDGFEVVLDKGTFDAISLMHYDAETEHPCETYRRRVTPLIKQGSFLFITSCNWTKDELVNWLATANSELAFYDQAKYPTFTFGGSTGQSVVTVIFRRLANK